MMTTDIPVRIAPVPPAFPPASRPFFSHIPSQAMQNVSFFRLPSYFLPTFLDSVFYHSCAPESSIYSPTVPLPPISRDRIHQRISSPIIQQPTPSLYFSIRNYLFYSPLLFFSLSIDTLLKMRARYFFFFFPPSGVGFFG